MRSTDRIEIRHLFISVAVFFILGSLLLTVSCRGVTPEPVSSPNSLTDRSSFPQDKSDLVPDPDVVFGRLPNGFRYVLMENHEPRDRVSMHLNVQAGSLNESDDQRGLAHFLEHMLFNGSEHFKPGELVKYFQSIGMQFGADANAHTGFKETVYDVLLPKGSQASIEKGLVVMKDYASGALLLESEIDRERGVILAEKQARDSADYRTFEKTIKFEFPESRISKRLPIGTDRAIRAADHAKLKDYYDTWYRPERMILVMVGDFDARMAERLIKERFSDLPARAPQRPVPDLGRIDHQAVTPFYYHEAESGNTSVTIERFVRVPEPIDSLSFERQVIVRQIADRVVQNRLDRILREPGSPMTSADVSSGYFLNRIAYDEISAQGDPDKWEEMLSLIEKNLRQARTYGFTEAELDRVKKEYVTTLDTAAKQASTRNSSFLARQIIRSLNGNRVFLSPRQEKKLFSDYILALTPEVVHEAFRAAWPPEDRLVLVTGNARIDGGTKQVRAAYDRSRAVAVAPPEALRTVSFPYLPVPGRSGTVRSRTEIPDLGIVQIDFENGIRLNLKKTDFKADEIRVTLSFGGGKSGEPADKPGLADLTEAVINESGLGGLNLDELERALAGKNTGVAFRVESDRFLFEGRTVPREITLLFELLRTYLVDPGYRRDAFLLSAERFRQHYAELSRSIDGAMDISGNRFLAGGDSRFGLPTRKAFDTLTLDDVKGWIDGPLRSSPFELSVVGDFDEAAVIANAARYLGSLSRHGAAAGVRRDPPVFPEGHTHDVKVKTEISKSLVVVAYPTEDFWDIHRTRRLSVLAGVFSERLRVQIREKLGAAYSPYAYNRGSRAYKGYGLLRVVVPTDPEKTGRVVREIRHIADSLATDGVGADEFRRVLDPILTGIKDMRRSNAYWLSSVMDGSVRHPEQLDWARSIVADYGAVSAGDLKKLAGRYLANDRAAVVIVTPESAGR